MAIILKLILGTILIFFVWNILKRIFFAQFYSFLNQNKPKQEQKLNKKEPKVEWDAETVDYEEIKPDTKK